MTVHVCPECFHVLGERAEQQRCPNCGKTLALDASPPLAAPVEPVDSATHTGLAVASLVCGLLGCIPILPQICAVVLGWFALRRRSSGAPQEYRGLAIAGIVFGLLFAAAWVAGFFLAGLPVTVAGSGTGAGYFTWPTITDDDDAVSAEQAESRINRIAESLDLFRRDYRRWPADLQELVPGYLPAETLEFQRTLDKYGEESDTVALATYIQPDEDKSDPIVVYSIEFDRDAEGKPLDPPKRWIIRKTGMVEWVDTSAVNTQPAPRPDRSP